jgi:hypothetical protein
MEVQAPDSKSAEFAALKWAAGCGFDQEIKKINVREESCAD